MKSGISASSLHNAPVPSDKRVFADTIINCLKRSTCNTVRDVAAFAFLHNTKKANPILDMPLKIVDIIVAIHRS